MTSTKEIIALLKSHVEGDEEQLFSVALQVAANEARRGHTDAAAELRQLISAARTRSSFSQTPAIPFVKARGELEGLLSVRQTRLKLQDVVLTSHANDQLARIIREQKERARLREHGKIPTQRLLLVGRPGTGKTMSAEALAGELSLPFFVIRLESLITRYLGETAAKLRIVFDEVARRRAVYLFDEFDAIGSRRGSTNDVAEMRRVLNSFLQFVEEYNATDSLIVAATNHPELLDRALLRRFEEVVVYELPGTDAIRRVLTTNLKPLKYRSLGWKTLLSACQGLSHAELKRAAEDVVKAAILEQTDIIKTADVKAALNKRKSAHAALAKIESL